MDYYGKKKLFYKDMKELLLDTKNANTRMSLAKLELRYAQGFGFGKSTVLKGLDLFAKFGYVRVDGESVVIYGKKEVSQHADNNTSATATGRVV